MIDTTLSPSQNHVTFQPWYDPTYIYNNKKHVSPLKRIHFPSQNLEMGTAWILNQKTVVILNSVSQLSKTRIPNL